MQQLSQAEEINEMRLRQLEQLTRTLVESQQSTVQIMTDHTYRLQAIERRLDTIEGQLDQIQTDLSFIKTILLRRNDAPES